MLISTRQKNGFSLIEIIIGIVVLAIALTLISPMLLPTEENSANQTQQVRAAELGQSLMNEILAKSFDESSNREGGSIRCNEVGAPSCTPQSAFGSDGESRDQFDDVDDYVTSGFTNTIVTSSNQSIASLYQGFSVNISVTYDGFGLGLTDNNLAKKITIQVKTPSGFIINFATYKANY